MRLQRIKDQFSSQLETGNMEFISSAKGKKMLIFNDFLYTLDKKYEESSYFRCCERKCTARVIMKPNENVIKGEHSHPNHLKKILQLKCLNDIKARAETNPFESSMLTFEMTRKRHFDDTAKAYGVETALNSTLKYTQVKKPIRKIRQVLREMNENRNDDFLLADVENPSMKIYGDVNLFLKYCYHQVMCMDGTFFACPEGYAQLYTIHVLVQTKFIPIIYVLMTDRKERSYAVLFERLKMKGKLQVNRSRASLAMLIISRSARSYLSTFFSEFSAQEFNRIFYPSTILLDFEKAAINAVSKCFEQTKLRGCIFHYSQSIWRAIQSNGLTNFFRGGLKSFFRLYLGLAFVPLARLDEAYSYIRFSFPPASHPAYSSCIEFDKYFHQTWFNSERAYFPRHLWNHYNNLGPRTTNGAEGWHHRLNKRISRAHPKECDLIDTLKQESFNAFIKSNNLVKSNVVVSQNDSRLSVLVSQLNSNSISLVDYLASVSRLVRQTVS